MKVRFSDNKDEFNFINELELNQIPRIGEEVYLIDKRYGSEDDPKFVWVYYTGKVIKAIWFLDDSYIEVIMEEVR